MFRLSSVLRTLMHGRGRPRAELPAPGPAPLARPRWEAVAILVIVTGGVLWLLAHGFSAGVAMGVLAGAGLITAELATALAGPRPVDL